MRPSMTHSLYKQSLFLVMHTKDNPTDAEWADYMDFTKANLKKIKSTVILTEGGGPNTMQRGQLNDFFEAEKFNGKVSVVTLSRLVRGIVTALGWFNPNIKAFSTIQIPAALEYLEVPAAEHDGVLREIKALRMRLGLPLT